MVDSQTPPIVSLTEGSLYRLKTGYSEAIVSLRLPCMPVTMRMVSPRTVQLYADVFGEQEYSFPILTGEAGIYQHISSQGNKEAYVQESDFIAALDPMMGAMREGKPVDVSEKFYNSLDSKVAVDTPYGKLVSSPFKLATGELKHALLRKYANRITLSMHEQTQGLGLLRVHNQRRTAQELKPASEVCSESSVQKPTNRTFTQTR